MENILNIDDYDALGNSWTGINSNFCLLNIRTCLVQDTDSISLTPLFSRLSSLSANYQQLYTTLNLISADQVSTSSIVFNTKGHWLSPVTIVYEKTFSVVANYYDIINWLNVNFLDTFHSNQILKVNYLVKSYSDSALSNTPIEKIDIADLDLIAGAYNQNTKDIKKYLVFKNHVNTIISVINNIFLSALRKDLIISERTGLQTYYESFEITFGILTSSLIKDIPYEYIEAIYTYLLQYQIIKDEYQNLIDKGIESIPSEVLIKFDLQNVYGSFFGSFCFIQDEVTNLWKFTPQCNIMFCADNICSDCYGYLDPNSLYEGRQCFGNDLYKLLLCPVNETDPISSFVSNNNLFKDYIDSYVDISVDGMSGKYYISKNGTVNYANSSVLLKSHYNFIGLSIDQTCPYVETLSDSEMIRVFDTYNELTQLDELFS